MYFRFLINVWVVISKVRIINALGILSFSVPPDILDYPTSTDMVVTEGSNVTLRCAATGEFSVSIFVKWNAHNLGSFLQIIYRFTRAHNHLEAWIKWSNLQIYWTKPRFAFPMMKNMKSTFSHHSGINIVESGHIEFRHFASVYFFHLVNIYGSTFYVAKMKNHSIIAFNQFFFGVPPLRQLDNTRINYPPIK